MGLVEVETDATPFVDLPAALVDEMLSKTEEVARSLLDGFRAVQEDRSQLRSTLESCQLLENESHLGCPPPTPTTCGIDGSYAIERLLSADLAACAAVAVEGLTPPTETRHWQQPHHRSFVRPEVHDADTPTVLRAVMLGYELLLAMNAPHDVVMLDGTLTLPVIYFNQALSKLREAPNLNASQEFSSSSIDFLTAYSEILQASRSDQNYVGLPKYSTRREIGRHLGRADTYDDRALLSLLLNPGELTRPIPLENPNQQWHIGTSSLPSKVQAHAKPLVDNIVSALNDIHVIYYKPHEWLPAIRLEVPRPVVENRDRLATVIQAVKYQCATPGILEPYPLYLADRMVKALARSVPAFRQVTTRQIAEQYAGPIDEIFFGMHGYRTESGR